MCIVDYCSKFPVMKKVSSLAAGELVQMAKMIFAEYELPKIISDVGKNFTSETFKVLQVDEHPAVHNTILPQSE